jgi:nucleotide-binding universal stress UspA family protein
MEKTFTILCPTDFSECSLNAIEYAARLGEKYNAILILFHVLNREDYLKISPLDTNGKNQVEFVKEKLKNLQRAVLEESLLNGLKGCEIGIQEGKIVNGALAYAKEIKADLILLGTEGMNELRANIIGSKASQMVEESDRDIIIVPRKVFFKRPRKFVYASDYLEEDKLAIQKIVQVAKFFDSEVDLVHISSSQKAIDKTLHMVMVDEIRPFVRYDKINYVLKSFRDDLALGLENYLQVAKGDMLVTLSKKKSFFERIFTKNLSKKMSYFLNKPLWVIKAF